MLRQIKRAVKFWREYAGSKPIHTVGDPELRDYVEWRRDYYTVRYVSAGKPLPQNAKLHPTDKTLQWELMLGKANLKWAHDKGLRGSAPRPTFAFTPKVKRVRPAFELAEYRLLYRTTRAHWGMREPAVARDTRGASRLRAPPREQRHASWRGQQPAYQGRHSPR